MDRFLSNSHSFGEMLCKPFILEGHRPTVFLIAVQQAPVLLTKVNQPQSCPLQRVVPAAWALFPQRTGCFLVGYIMVYPQVWVDHPVKTFVRRPPLRELLLWTCLLLCSILHGLWSSIYLNVDKTMFNHPWLGMVTIPFIPAIYGDLGDGLSCLRRCSRSFTAVGRTAEAFGTD